MDQPIILPRTPSACAATVPRPKHLIRGKSLSQPFFVRLIIKTEGKRKERKACLRGLAKKKKINEMDRQHINPLCLGCCKERIKRKERRRHGKFAIETRLKKVRPKKLSDRFTPTQEISKTIEVASD